MSDFRKIKTITSYAGHARFLAECDWDADENLIIAGYLARAQREHIPSPYAYSPSTQIYLRDGKKIIISEVSHRRYEVYEIAANMRTFKTDDAATEWNFRHSKK